MKKLFIAAQWCAVAFLLISLVYFFFRKDLPPDYNPSTWKSWAGFYALAYEGVTDSDDPRYVSPDRLEEHLKALRNAGFNTITPADVEAYYYDDKPLPEHAVMLLFEGGRKDHIVRATPRLIMDRFIGVLCVPTTVTDKWGSHFVSRSDLRRLARSSHWQLASMGHEAIDMINVDDQNHQGHFLSRRKWSRHGRETDGLFEDRIVRDYRKASDILVGAGGRPVSAYLYPYGDAAQGAESDPLAEMINRGAVREFHKLAFTQEGRPFNDYYNDPYALSRLRARGDWSGEELVQYLKEWMSDFRPVTGFTQADRWQILGLKNTETDEITLGDRQSALLRGSGSWSDLEFSAVADVPTGSMAIVYFRFSGSHAYIRLTIHESGIRIQEKRAGKLQTLAWRPLEGLVSNRHAVNVRIKSNRIWLEHNGHMIARSIPVSRKTQIGHLWLSAEGGEVTFRSFAGKPVPPLYVIGGEYETLPGDVRSRATVLMPRWFDGHQPLMLSEKNQLDIMRAAQDGILTVPVIETPSRLSMDEARLLASKVSELLSYMTVRMLTQQLAATGYQPELYKAFRELGLNLYYLVSPEEAARELERGLILSRDERFIVEGAEEYVLAVAEECGKTIPPHRLVLELNSGTPLPVGAVSAINLDPRPRPEF